MPCFILYSKAKFACYSRCFTVHGVPKSRTRLSGQHNNCNSQLYLQVAAYHCYFAFSRFHFVALHFVKSSIARVGNGTDNVVPRAMRSLPERRDLKLNLSVYTHHGTIDCVDHNKLWKILKEMGIPDHLTCLLRNLYAGQEATVRTGQGTTDWFQIGKGVCQGCILSPCLFNFCAEYIM